MNTGQQIINAIIAGGLCKAHCSDNNAHSCVVVWSSGAAEQIEAFSDMAAAPLKSLVESAITDFQKLGWTDLADIYQLELNKLTE